MADFYESILPSGRAIRIERLFTKEYREAQRRAGAKAVQGQPFNFNADLAHELLLSSLRGLTAAKVDLVFKQKADGEAKELDVDATLDAVPPAAWSPMTYESLVSKGETSIYMVLKDVADYEAAALFAQQVVAPMSPLGAMVAGRSRMVSSTQ